jgi:hypothetical protein
MVRPPRSVTRNPCISWHHALSIGASSRQRACVRLDRGEGGAAAAGRPTVTCLFAARRPAAIARLIIAIHVSSIERTSRRTLSQIGEKRFKAGIAKLNAASAIVGETPIVWISAAALCGLVNAILGRARHSMCRVQFAPHLPSKAAARPGMSLNKHTAA